VADPHGEPFSPPDVSARGVPARPGKLYVSSGCLPVNLDAQIVDPVTLSPVEDGETGEIWVSGATVTAGYWNNHAATAETFGARLAGIHREFLRTGDLGFLRDRQLFVTGRRKDLIIVRGQNYYPHDIERTAVACHPVLRAGHAAAFSTSSRIGESVCLALELVPQRVQPDYEEIGGAVRQAVAHVHDLTVHAIALLRAGDLPMTTSGKVQRGACREALLLGSIRPVWSTGLNVIDENGFEEQP